MAGKAKSHHEVITSLGQRLSQIVTESKFIHNLGHPEHSQYQQCWNEFDKKYHQAIIYHILQRANWRQNEQDKAEDILHLVYLKGWQWSFKRLVNGKLRRAINTLVRDVLRDYFRELGRPDHPIFLGDHDPSDPKGGFPDYDADEIIAVAEELLAGYPEKQRRVLNWIWNDPEHYWPNSEQLKDLLEAPTGEAARKWKERHKTLWDDFQERIRKALGEW